MNEQINQESNSVETPRDATEVFTDMLDAEESNDKPEVENEEVATEAVEETDEEALEDEVEEESEEDEPEDTEEEDESEEVEVEERKTYRVKASGEEKDVTLDELVSGYQKSTDYTQKSQQLAEERKKVEAHAQEVQNAMRTREAYAQKLAQVEQYLVNSQDPSENLEELKENDPIQYAIKVAEQTEANKKINAIRQEQQKVSQEQHHYRLQQQNQVVQNEAKMLSEKVKEFSDPKKAEQIKNDIRNFGKSVGFSDQELSQVYDHRHVMILQKAMEYDKLQKANPGVTKKLKSAPKMASKTKKVANTDVYTKQKKRLKSSGSIEDATSVFTNFI
jgi:hypothetical protein